MAFGNLKFDTLTTSGQIHGSEVSIAKKIPMKYLKYFKEVTGSGNGMKVRYRFRGNSKSWYGRPQSFCHMHGADTFAVYGR